jgi:hypothetical protein
MAALAVAMCQYHLALNRMKSMDTCKRLGVLFFFVCLLTGCPTASVTKPVTVKSQDEAASVLVSPTMVMPWNQISDAMQPDFALTGDQAAAQVVPTTARIQDQVLSAFGASLGVGLPQTFSQSSKTNTSSAATNTTTGPGDESTASSTTATGKNNTATSTAQAGVVPSVPTGIPASGQSVAAPSISGDISIDPVTKYQAGLALFESVQMLNREVQNAAVLAGEVPFLVKIKLAVMPYRPHLAYTLHSRISFFQGCVPGYTPLQLTASQVSGGNSNSAPSTAVDIGSGFTPLMKQRLMDAKLDQAQLNVFLNIIDEKPATPAPISSSSSGCDPSLKLPQIIPLLAADNMERALKSSAAEVANQIGVALSIMSNGVGGNFGLNKLNQSISAISGQDLNSRLTIARQSDNTLYVRIGAANEATAGAALVGQTYDIALLLLVPKEYFKQEDPRIRIVSHTQFRNAFDGTVLEDRSAATLVEQFDKVMHQIFVGPSNVDLAAWGALTLEDKEKVARAIAKPIQESNFDNFSKIIDDSNFNGASFQLTQPKNGDDGYVNKQNLWAAASTILADTALKSAFFELHKPGGIEIPDQTAFILDDGKEKAVVQLVGVYGPSANNLRAKLELVSKAKNSEAYKIGAQAITLDSASHLLNLTFPSLDKLGIGEIDIKNTGNALIVSDGPCPDEVLCSHLKGTSSEQKFGVFLKKSAASDQVQKLSFSSKVKTIVANKGVGTVVVSIDKLKDGNYAILSVDSGADILAATDSAGAAITVSDTGIKVSKKGAVKLQLQNLDVRTPVNISVEEKMGEKSISKASLVFSVSSN